MSNDGVDVGLTVRQAIGGDRGAVTWIIAEADVTTDPVIITMAALLEGRPERLRQALAAAQTSRDRQLVAIADACLTGDRALVDALARDHLVDHPGSFIVAWMASNPTQPQADPGRP
jgi:hypothetical protein